MSDEQKNGVVAGAADQGAIEPARIQPTELPVTGADAETKKARRRATTKEKAAADTGAEVKPKRTRPSPSSSKTKNVLTKALQNEDVRHAEGPGRGKPALSEPDNLPPLPPAPVPTPEGIAFMQQHVAFQTALEQRAALRRAQLNRSGQTAQANPSLVGQEQGKPGVRLSGTMLQTKAALRDVDASGNASTAKPATVKASKAIKENVIEPGREIGKGPVGEAGRHDFDDAGDGLLLRQLLDRSRGLSSPRNATSANEPAAAIAQSDVGTLRMIKDVVARKLGLAMVDHNRQAHPDYKAEFDRLAPDLKTEGLEANDRQRDALRSSAAALDKTDDTVARSTAIPDSVRKRFLKVDSDYFFPDRSPAFVDRGGRLATRGEHPEVVVALVEIAKERGWNSITVKGSENFRRAAWMEATRNGMQVAGYKPTELDLTQLNQREPANLIEPGNLREQGQARPTSLAKPGDQALNEKLAAFANDKSTLAVKKYPDLVQAYALLDAARKFAEAHMPGYEAKFIAIGRELITQQIREGREIIGPKVHPDQISQSRSARNRSGIGTEKTPQSEVQVRER